jgi:phage shock protein PspC (stress-responsive transcriptional regulator)
VRSTNDRKLAGVCAGVADYFDIDPTLIRILWALETLIPGPNIIAYIIIWIAADEGPTGMARTSATAVS